MTPPDTTSEGPQAGSKTSLADRFLAAEDSVQRFDRWVEFISAIVLALATVATAWCGYQATQWGGEEAAYRAGAGAATTRAAQMSNEAVQVTSLHANLFVAWVTAFSEDNQELADFLYQRFPPELKTATDAWLTTEPRTNPDAPPSPFAMPEYVVAQSVEASRWDAEAKDQAQLAEQANETSDRYVLLTVLFASVLFFGGISGKFQSRIVDVLMLVLAGMVLLAGLGVLLSFPVQ